MTRINPGRILTAVVVAALAVASGAPALAMGWKDHYGAGLKAMKAGDYDKAEALMKQAGAAAEAGGDGDGGTHAVVKTLVGLSDICIIQKRTAESAVLLDQALLMLVRSPKSEQADFGMVYSSLGVLRGLQKNYPEAESLLKRALTIREKTLGPNDPELASTLDQLATVCLLQKNESDAETYARRALAIREKKPEAEPLDLATSCRTLAVIAADQEHYAEAEALFRRVVALKEKALGPEHPGVATTLAEFGGIRLVKGMNQTLFSLPSFPRTIRPKRPRPRRIGTPPAFRKPPDCSRARWQSARRRSDPKTRRRSKWYWPWRPSRPGRKTMPAPKLISGDCLQVARRPSALTIPMGQ